MASAGPEGVYWRSQGSRSPLHAVICLTRPLPPSPFTCYLAHSPSVDEDDEPMSPAVVTGGGAGGAAGATPASASASASSAHRGHIGLEGKTGGIPLHQYRRAGAGGVGAGGGAGVTATRGSSGTVGGGAASASASASSRAAHPGYERWREELEPGDPVDVLDTVHKWSAAQVIKVKVKQRLTHTHKGTS